MSPFPVLIDVGAYGVAVVSEPLAIGLATYGALDDMESRMDAGQTAPEVFRGLIADVSGFNSVQAAWTNKDVATQKSLGLSRFDRGMALTTGGGQLFGWGLLARRGVGKFFTGSASGGGTPARRPAEPPIGIGTGTQLVVLARTAITSCVPVPIP